MRKLIMTALMSVIAVLAVTGVASADVPRYQAQTGTITVTLPKYGLVHTFNVTAMNPCDGSFTATGTRNIGNINEDVTGSLKDGQLSFDATYTGPQETGYQWHVSGLKGHDTTNTDEADGGFDVTFTSNLSNSTNYKNHGDYVKAQGGGDDAAHSCIGMPINSSK